LYSPLVGAEINEEGLQGIMIKIPQIVNAAFREHFGEYSGTGKVMLQEEVIRVYVRKLIGSDITLAGKNEKTGHKLKVLALEKEFTAPIEIIIGGQKETAYVRGKTDRIDEAEGAIRIIDYKSSVRTTDKFRFQDFDSLFRDPNYTKLFQLLTYAWLLYKNEFAPPEGIRPCIIPFRTFREEPYFITGAHDGPLVLTRDFFKEFERELAAFVESIFDPREQFVQTTDTSVCRFCAYNEICLRAE
jgi:CRISPR/Cas system-associated exonuclease Cas4 (RecB family)